jgi:3-methylcrotonyl-CoA carboxylase alpha subunit
MGLKDAAKALMQEAGVPVVPGYHGENQEAEHLSGAADAIGYPVLIKAVAGGGGKGMRKVAARRVHGRAGQRPGGGGDGLRQRRGSYRKIRREAAPYRGAGLRRRDARRASVRARLLAAAAAPEGDRGGARARHDGGDARRDGAAAVRAAEAIGYSGAGTVEFIVDASDGLRPDRFYFMEMNTRLQVEHPVTEAITGVDLVEWQLRVASGEALPAAQEDLSITGHAIEARLYAEDVPPGSCPRRGGWSICASARARGPIPAWDRAMRSRPGTTR